MLELTEATGRFVQGICISLWRWVFQILAEEASWRRDLHGSNSPTEQNANIVSWSEYPMELQDHKIVMTSSSPTPLIKHALKIIAFQGGEDRDLELLEKVKVRQCLQK